MALTICVLASGSTGNVTAIWSDKTGVLIDCGRSRRFIEESLASAKLDISKLKGVLITHGHGDHVGSSMISIASTYQVPLHIHEETYSLILNRPECTRLAQLDPGLIRHHTEEEFVLGTFVVRPFASSHSGGFAGRTYGFCVEDGSCKIGFLTDTGKIDEKMIEALLDCDALIIEANHDPEMVNNSTRHPVNKKWILSDCGHLSNEDHARALVEIIRRSKKRPPRFVFLAHISNEHNTPLDAIRQIRAVLKDHGMDTPTLIPTFHGRSSIALKL